jgi:hypothetical protein
MREREKEGLGFRFSVICAQLKDKWVLILLTVHVPKLYYAFFFLSWPTLFIYLFWIEIIYILPIVSWFVIVAELGRDDHGLILHNCDR